MPKQQSRPGSAHSLVSQLASVAERMEAWKRQKATLTADLNQIVESASHMIVELGAGGSGRDATVRRKGGRPKGYRMSEATRRRLKAAWKRRKASASQTRHE